MKLKTKKEKPEMFTTTISLEAETHKRLSHLAIDEDRTVRELIREAIEELLARREKGARK